MHATKSEIFACIFDLAGLQALKAHAADNLILVCRYGAAALARGLRSPDLDTLPERTRTLHRRPQERWLGERSMLQKLGLRVACLVALVRHKDYREKDATPRPAHARNTISQRGTGASQSRNWLAARDEPARGGQEAFARMRPTQRQA